MSEDRDTAMAKLETNSPDIGEFLAVFREDSRRRDRAQEVQRQQFEQLLQIVAGQSASLAGSAKGIDCSIDQAEASTYQT